MLGGDPVGGRRTDLSSSGKLLSSNAYPISPFFMSIFADGNGDK